MLNHSYSRNNDWKSMSHRFSNSSRSFQLYDVWIMYVFIFKTNRIVVLLCSGERATPHFIFWSKVPISSDKSSEWFCELQKVLHKLCNSNWWNWQREKERGEGEEQNKFFGSEFQEWKSGFKLRLKFVMYTELFRWTWGIFAGKAKKREIINYFL